MFAVFCIIATLRAIARDWWINIQLRAEGNVAQALKLERAHALDMLRDLRKARRFGGWVLVGRGGITLYLGDGSYISGFDERMVKLCIAIGLPVVDTTTVGDAVAHRLVSCPMVGGDKPPWTALCYAPLNVYAALCKILGATLYNIKPAIVEPAMFSPTVQRAFWGRS